ncbi:hypothetical protein BVC80_8921g10 [Macleaya cordata]|uniref:Uncharacterized protein n=1 Tax=Macleaya cordata TaxID=56857 RepID=A0A200PW94_MACCD|nr:hypothetical protein BVC80_8921g10 [Macleaya cordata]
MANLDATQELQFFTVQQIITKSVRIPITSSPRRFFLITVFLILPLSIAQLYIDDHHQILISILDHFKNPTDQTHKELIHALIYEFFYIIILLIFSLFSTAAIVFTVASLYLLHSHTLRHSSRPQTSLPHLPLLLPPHDLLQLHLLGSYSPDDSSQFLDPDFQQKFHLVLLWCHDYDH